MTVRRSLLILTVLTVAVLVVFSVAQANQLQQTQNLYASAAQNVEGYVVQPQTVETRIGALGEIDADGVYDVSFSRSGQVAEIFVVKGDYVRAGTPLARLNNDTEKIAVDRAWLNVQLQQLLLDDLMEVDDDDVRPAEADVQAAQAAYSSAFESVMPEDIQAAELRYQQAHDAYIAANEARQIAQGSPEYIASLDAKIGEASFNMEIARLALEDLRGSNQFNLNLAAANINEANRRLDQVEAGPTARQIEDRQIAIEQAEMARRQAELTYSRTVLLAPVDGVVASLDMELGERVRSGSPVLRIADLTPLEAVIDVDEIDVSSLSVGMPIRLQFDALPGVTLTGQVEDIPEDGDDLNGVIRYAVHVSLDVADARLRPDMTVNADVITASTSALAVPARYVHDENGQPSVTVIYPNGKQNIQPVSLGLRGADYVEIVSGLQAGDVIVGQE